MHNTTEPRPSPAPTTYTFKEAKYNPYKGLLNAINSGWNTSTAHLRYVASINWHDPIEKLIFLKIAMHAQLDEQGYVRSEVAKTYMAQACCVDEEELDGYLADLKGRNLLKVIAQSYKVNKYAINTKAIAIDQGWLVAKACSSTSKKAAKAMSMKPNSTNQ